MKPLHYPKTYSEFEVQAHLYMKLLNEGLTARGEVSDSTNRSRYDIVVYDSDRVAKLIIEVKSRKRVRSYKKAHQTKQMCKYKRRELPVITCLAMWNVNSTAALAKRIVNGSDGWW